MYRRLCIFLVSFIFVVGFASFNPTTSLAQIPTNTPAPTPSLHGTCGPDAIKTGLGCLDVTGTKTIEILLNWATGLGAGIAFILIIIAGLQVTTAAGDAKRVKAGQELLTSAIVGFILISLSVVLLNFIGVNVLGLNSLGFFR